MWFGRIWAAVLHPALEQRFDETLLSQRCLVNRADVAALAMPDSGGGSAGCQRSSAARLRNRCGCRVVGRDCRSRQFGAGEVGAGKVGTLQVAPAEVRALQVCAP